VAQIAVLGTKRLQVTICIENCVSHLSRSSIIITVVLVSDHHFHLAAHVSSIILCACYGPRSGRRLPCHKGTRPELSEKVGEDNIVQQEHLVVVHVPDRPTVALQMIRLAKGVK